MIKLLEGRQGIGVVLAETHKAGESVIEAFMGLDANILVQEFIKEAGGEDLRCLVVGGKVIAAMKHGSRWRVSSKSTSRRYSRAGQADTGRTFHGFESDQNIGFKRVRDRPAPL